MDIVKIIVSVVLWTRVNFRSIISNMTSAKNNSATICLFASGIMVKKTGIEIKKKAEKKALLPPICSW